MTMGVVGYDPAAEAQRVLGQVWRDAGVPVDPVRIARRLGLMVVVAKMKDDEVTGILEKEAGRDPVIFVNRFDSIERKRFMCAHEIGHFVGRPSDLDHFKYVDRRDAVLAGNTDPEEAAANAFAAALLVPATEKRRLLGRRGFEEIELAWEFQVPREVMHNRLVTLSRGHPS